MVAHPRFRPLGLLFWKLKPSSGKGRPIPYDPQDEISQGSYLGVCRAWGCSSWSSSCSGTDKLRRQAFSDGKDVYKRQGQAAVETARQVAHVKCSGTCEKAKEEYVYTGVEDCEMLPFVPNGGAKSCTYGCCGFGSCVKVCPFDAIHIVDGIAVVDKEACKACGKCVAKCPRHLIELIPYDQKVAVDCSSHDKGKQVMDACEIGCIGCKKCEKTCPNGAITVEDFCAHIDYEKCTGCGACKEACPRGVIREA